MRRVEVSDQVRKFVREQAPESRKRLRLGIRRLEAEKGDICALEGPLKGYHRLRVGAFRIVFAYATSAEGVGIRCIFAERRDVVYGVFADILKAKLLKEQPSSPRGKS